MTDFVTIVPKENSLSPVGTKVYDSKGNEISGITSVDLCGAADGAWKAKITCFAHISGKIIAIPEMNKEILSPAPSLWEYRLRKTRNH